MKKSDISVLFYKSRGPGGQRKNRKETAVKITHMPTGIVARATEHRSQSQNRELAMKRLRQKLAKSTKPVKKRKSTRKPFGVRERELKEKKIHSAKKALRKKLTLLYKQDME